MRLRQRHEATRDARRLPTGVVTLTFPPSDICLSVKRRVRAAIGRMVEKYASPVPCALFDIRIAVDVYRVTAT